MLLLIAALVALATVLLVLGIGGLVAPDEASVVTRRLQRLQGAPTPRQAARLSESRTRAERALRSLGNRFVASRANLDELRASLAQAGYRNANALPMYFALRFVLIGGLALLSLVTVPLFTDAPAAGLLALPYFVLAGWLLPRTWLKRRVAERQAKLQRALPDTLDLLVVCVEAGLGLNQALVRVAREIGGVSPVMGAELRMLNLEIQAGTSRDEAFRNLGDRTGSDDIRSLASMLIQADRFGTSVAQALRVQADTLRVKRRQRAEEAAAKTTVKLVFPLVIFIFPALFVIILGPAVLSIMGQGLLE